MSEQWISMWANATSLNDRRAESYGKNLTLRYPVFCPLDGTSLKLTFSNRYGTEPVTLSRITVARSDGSRGIDVSTVQPVTFGGGRACTMGPGEECTSDALSYAVRRGDWIAVNVYLEGYTDLTSAVLVTGPLSKGFFSVGDDTERGSLLPDLSRTTNWFYFLNRIDIVTQAPARAVVCYGDSITAQAWPDYLSRLAPERTAVLRRAVCGTRVLREYNCITYASYGKKGSARFEHELSTCVGTDTVIIQHGINDIIHPVGTEVNPFRPWSDLPTAAELIEGLKKYIVCARALKHKVYLGTLLPIRGWRTYAPFREDLKNAVNDWIRTTSLADGVIDFAAAVSDPEDATAFAPGYDSGDHLHPSQRAYERMAQVAADVLFGAGR